MSGYPRSSVAEIVQAARQLATRRPELVFRNSRKVEQGWQAMREDRAAFVEFCGGDELVLSPAEAEDLLNAYYRHRQESAVAGHPDRARGRRVPGLDLPFFELPPELADSDTIGVIYDQVDGLNFYADYGMLRGLFADPALAGRKQYQDDARGVQDPPDRGQCNRMAQPGHRHDQQVPIRRVNCNDDFSSPTRRRNVITRKRESRVVGGNANDQGCDLGGRYIGTRRLHGGGRHLTHDTPEPYPTAVVPQ
jgi:hypothetical protein